MRKRLMTACALVLSLASTFFVAQAPAWASSCTQTGEKCLAAFPGSVPDTGSARLVIDSGLGNCPAGYLCAWQYSNYQGRGVAFYNSEADWAQTGDTSFMNNFAYSFYNNGYAGSVGDVRLFDAAGLTGRNIVLCNRESIAYLPTAAQARTTWLDTMSSHQWGSYC
ncbi:MAG: Peptidase inhibitor family [Actinomycetota bacterium]|nr:Peptidase inhibitor family [Actinomycetota bacterium]